MFLLRSFPASSHPEKKNVAWRAVSGSRYFILSLSLSLSHSFFLSVHLALFCFWLAVRGWTLFDAEWLHSLLIAVETGFYLSSQVGDTCFIKTNKQTNQVKQIKGSGGRKKKKRRWRWRRRRRRRKSQKWNQCNTIAKPIRLEPDLLSGKSIYKHSKPELLPSCSSLMFLQESDRRTTQYSIVIPVIKRWLERRINPSRFSVPVSSFLHPDQIDGILGS